MGDKTKIQWTDATWNVAYGCTRTSPGCDNCYAVRQTQRLAGTLDFAKGLVNAGKGHFNGKVNLLPQRLDQPLRWKRPRMIFVNSLSDLFHPDVPFEFVDRVFAVMALASRPSFQLLTKRPERMAEYIQRTGRSINFLEVTARAMGWTLQFKGIGLVPWPLPNVWLGASVENQAAADERIPHLLQTPAAVRWLNMEPLLGPVDLVGKGFFGALGWVVVGGESGPGARPMHPDWVRSLRDQCQAAMVPFFFKQWGAWKPDWTSVNDGNHQFKDLGPCVALWPDGSTEPAGGEAQRVDWAWSPMQRVGKKAAGRELDRRTWDEYPTWRGER